MIIWNAMMLFTQVAFRQSPISYFHFDANSCYLFPSLITAFIKIVTTISAIINIATIRAFLTKLFIISLTIINTPFYRLCYYPVLRLFTSTITSTTDNSIAFLSTVLLFSLLLSILLLLIVPLLMKLLFQPLLPMLLLLILLLTATAVLNMAVSVIAILMAIIITKTITQ